ncbi:hypothetical protein Tco_1092152 [Tanacetum coccineum]|uniref:MAK10-like protein n=1 Tax=Tanacetum coccineum TaxID=301880 RepID=A0ABQ5IAA8_9ASTR
MKDENPIRTLGDYSKPSHEGYKNTIELPVGNNVVPLRSDTIRLVQNGCSFYGLRSEDPNQHLKDFLKLVDSLDLDGANRERTRLRTAKLCNDILMFQQHQGQSLSESWTHFKDLLTKVPHHDIDLWLQVHIFYDHVNPVTRQTINQSAGDKLRDKNAKESWALLEDLSFYDNKSWNDPSDFSKLVKAISLPQDVSSTSDRRLVELKSSPTLDGSSFFSDTTYSSEQNHFLIPKAQMNFTSTNYHTEEEIRGKGIKSPSKLLSSKYLSQSSLAELNKAEEEGSLKSGATEYRNLEMTITDEEEVESEEEFEEGTKEETKKEEEGDPEHFDTFPL